ncbi:MAG: hypothetical protein AB8B91_25760, partial [Rubripirellula sp.]
SCQRDGPIGIGSIDSGIELARWFASEAERVYAALRITVPEDDAGKQEQAQSRELDRLFEWIESQGGSVTEREIQGSLRRYRNEEKRRQDITLLISSGRAAWDTSDRRSTRLVISSALTRANAPTANALASNTGAPEEVLAPGLSGVGVDNESDADRSGNHERDSRQQFRQNANENDQCVGAGAVGACREGKMIKRIRI